MIKKGVEAKHIQSGINIMDNLICGANQKWLWGYESCNYYRCVKQKLMRRYTVQSLSETDDGTSVWNGRLGSKYLIA